MAPGLLRYTPTGHPEWEKPTALFFVEPVPNTDQWIVAIPNDATSEDAVSVRTQLGHSEPVEFMQIRIPEGLVNAPPRNAIRFEFEDRSGDGLEAAQVALRIPRALAPPVPIPEVRYVERSSIAEPSGPTAAEVAAMAQRLQALEEQTRSGTGPDARRLFGPPTRESVAIDADRARRLAGPPPRAAPSVVRPRLPLREPEPAGQPPTTMEGRIVSALEALVAVKSRASAESEDREEVDVAGAITTGGGKGIARLRKLSETYARAPGRRWDHVAMVASEAGQETVAAYMENCTQVRRDRLTAYLTSMFCRIAAAAQEGDVERVLGRCAAGLIFCDQWAIDGNIQLAWQMTLEQEPAVLRRHPDTPIQKAFPKSRRAPFSQLQFSQLAEPQVTEAALAATRNWKEFREAAEKLQQE